MKKALLIAVVITAASLSAIAQNGKKDRFANLNLTATQKTSVDSVRKVYDAERAALKNDASIAADAKTEKMKEVRKAQNHAINSILTDEQKQQLKKEAKENKKEGE
jgi:hypothetical protein